MANSNMKDFTSFNNAFQSLSTSSRAQVAMRLLNASESIKDTVQGLPTDYARAYAGVITQEYDADNHVQDVTPDKPRATVDYLIVDAKAKFEAAVNVMDSLKDSFNGNTTCTIPDDSSFSYGLEKISQYIIFLNTINPGSNPVRIGFNIITKELVFYFLEDPIYSEEVPADYPGYHVYAQSVGSSKFLIAVNFLLGGKIYNISAFEDISNGFNAFQMYLQTNYDSRKFGAVFNIANEGHGSTMSTTKAGSYDGLSLAGATVSISNSNLLGLVDPTAMQSALNALV